MLNDGKIKIGDFGFGKIVIFYDFKLLSKLYLKFLFNDLLYQIEGDMNEAIKQSRKCTPLYGVKIILKKDFYNIFFFSLLRYYSAIHIPVRQMYGQQESFYMK